MNETTLAAARMGRAGRGRNRSATRLIACLCGLCIALASQPSAAGAEKDPQDWRFSALVYLWAAGINGETSTGGDVDISFNDIISNLDMTFMGTFEARKDKLSLLADVIYLNISEDDGGSENIPVDGTNVTVRVDTNVRLKSWINSFGAAYNIVQQKKGNLDVLAGARYLYMDTTIKLDTQVGSLPKGFKRLSESDHVWDGVIGVRGRLNLDERWYVPAEFDVGAGQSDSTWQAMAGVGYQFDWGHVILAYRYLHYNFDSDFPMKDLTVSGAALGVRFDF
jgi:hypothetical protein